MQNERDLFIELFDARCPLEHPARTRLVQSPPQLVLLAALLEYNAYGNADRLDLAEDLLEANTENPDLADEALASLALLDTMNKDQLARMISVWIDDFYLNGPRGPLVPT